MLMFMGCVPLISEAVPMPTRILVVDDHAIVRRSICSLLSSDPTLDVICETADGQDAVEKAAQLLPDLVLLDIGLPTISGIEAARQIQKVSPRTRILFLSQHDSVHMVKAAMKVGGHGYVTKMDASSELLKAIQSVRDGTQFVSGRVRGWQ
jgi:DNA-binding NarL/FixJ family response regulator